MPEPEITRLLDVTESAGVIAGFEEHLEPVVQTRPYDPFFGDFLGALRDNLHIGGSEFGTLLTLFSLAVSTRSKYILEIGRNRGLSTLALAGAVRFIEMGWDEAESNKQRPDMAYEEFEGSRKGMVWSVDIDPNPAAVVLLEKYGLRKYVTLVDRPSCEVESEILFDLMFIDGDHSFRGCLDDVMRFVPKYLRPGGYFILHDYFGWYVNGKSCSPIMQVIQKCLGEFDQVLIDTGYQSFVMFRKQRIQCPVSGKENKSSFVVPGPMCLMDEAEPPADDVLVLDTDSDGK